MKNVLLIKDIYFEAFRNLGYKIAQNTFRVYFWICVGLLSMALVGLVYRIATGFAFD